MKFAPWTVLVLLAITATNCGPVQAGHNEDQRAIATAMSRGDYRTALPLLQRAASEGDTQAQSTLATMYMTGIPGVVAKNEAAAIPLYEKAAAKMNGQALGALGAAYVHGRGVSRDYNKAFDYLNKSVDQGNSFGKVMLAVCYLKGWGTEQNPEKYFQLTREAAFQKMPGAAFNLGNCYRRGLGVAADQKEAGVWYAKALPELLNEVRRRPDSYEMLVALATMYHNGWGTPKDPAKASQFFKQGLPLLKKAMAENKSNAYLTYGELAQNGWGMAKDSAAAESAYKKASTLGDKEADLILAKASSP